MIVLVTGGSGSGKSDFAESVMMKLCPGRKYYIATMMAWGDEGAARVARHRAMRQGKGFETLEQPLGVQDAPVPWGGAALVECLSNLLANERFDPHGAGESCVYAVLEGLDTLKRRCAHLVIVTNEVFSDGVSYDADTLRYIADLGLVNRTLATWADAVIEVVCGLPQVIKGKNPLEGNI